MIQLDTECLVKISGVRSKLCQPLVVAMNTLLPIYGIDNEKELAHFLAQACHETDHFNTLEEYASGDDYENRKDLGNTQKGDGVRFKGRGIFQITGRANYQQLGTKLGKTNYFTNNPMLLNTPLLAVWSACEFWDQRNLNAIANLPDETTSTRKMKGYVHNLPPIEYITSVINGGFNGLAERKIYYSKAKRVLSLYQDIENVEWAIEKIDNPLLQSYLKTKLP